MSNKLMANAIYEQSSNIILEQMSVSKDAPKFTVARLNSEEEGLEYPFIIYIVQHKDYVAFHVIIIINKEHVQKSPFIDVGIYGIDLSKYVSASKKLIKHHYPEVDESRLLTADASYVSIGFDYKDVKKVENLVTQAFNNAQSQILIKTSSL